MGKKGKKTRWRRLPIGGTDDESGLRLESPAPPADRHRVTFNEDEYTKITTPRQDVLFKKGYFGRKRTPPNPSPAESQDTNSAGAYEGAEDTVENEMYMSEEPQYAFPAPTGYVDPTGVYYVNGNTFEAYDPYTGTVTVVVGPPAQYPGAPPVLAALPCQPVPLQPVEWFNPAAAAPWCYSYNRRKRYSTDSQNLSAQSSESTGPPGSPQEPVDEAAAAMYPPPPGPHYVYPGYMFGPPIYNMNGMTVQGVMPPAVPMAQDQMVNKRRKKRRRRRRGGVTDDGSESSCCEEPLTCDVTGCQSETSQSGASSDAGVGPNSDSGINTNSGSNSPPLEHPQQHEHLYTSLCPQTVHESVVSAECVEPEAEIQVSEELSTAEDDITPQLCAAASEFSSQESTLSCLSTPSAARDLVVSEHEVYNDVAQEEEAFESCQSVSLLREVEVTAETESEVEVSPCRVIDVECLPQLTDLLPLSPNDNLPGHTEENPGDTKDVPSELEDIPTAFELCNRVESLEIEPVLSELNESLEMIPNSIYEEDSDSMSVDEPLVQDEEIAQEVLEEKLEIPPAQENITNSVAEEEKLGEEQLAKNENMKEFVVSFVFQQENRKTKTVYDERFDDTESTDFGIKKIKEEGIEEVCVANSAALLDTSVIMCNKPPRLSFTNNNLAPVPPPRRKKSLSRVSDKIATKVVEEAIKEGLEEAARVRLKGPLSITEAVTRWLNSHESSPLTCPASDDESDNDEGIETEEEEMTGQKNVRGNPFPASSHSDAGQRVANDCDSLSSAGEWDLYDHSHTREMCDPARSVDKYYRLGADEGVPSVYKTAMHIRHTGPLPCGVCCIIQ